MNPVVKDKWIGALLSEKYTQGYGRLGGIRPNEDGILVTAYCCLGVLCELAVEAGVAERVVTYLNNEGHAIFGYRRIGSTNSDPDRATLPRCVATWAGLEYTDPMVILTDDEGEQGIASVNDAENPFPTIAELIRAQH